MRDCKESEKPQSNLYVIRIGKGKVVDLRMGTFIWKYACGTVGYSLSEGRRLRLKERDQARNRDLREYSTSLWRGRHTLPGGLCIYRVKV